MADPKKQYVFSLDTTVNNHQYKSGADVPAAVMAKQLAFLIKRSAVREKGTPA